LNTVFHERIDSRLLAYAWPPVTEDAFEVRIITTSAHAVGIKSHDEEKPGTSASLLRPGRLCDSRRSSGSVKGVAE
jgi:hypothetical protein